jgi:hypothetical protein
LIEDVRVMLNNLQLWRVIHVRREANGVAHEFANEAFFLMDEQAYLEECPLFILNIVTVERSNFNL